MWTHFMPLCLANLKHKDAFTQHTALVAVCRLVWVYCTRIRGESNEVTDKKLRLVAETVFPPKSTTIVPKDDTTTLFVELVQYMSLVRKLS